MLFSKNRKHKVYICYKYGQVGRFPMVKILRNVKPNQINKLFSENVTQVQKKNTTQKMKQKNSQKNKLSISNQLPFSQKHYFYRKNSIFLFMCLK